MFIGEKEIEKVEDTTVLFKDGTEQECTKKELETIMTEEETDLTGLRGLMIDKIVPELLEVLMEYNIKKGDVQAILNELVGSYNDGFNRAIGKAFGTYEEGKHSAYFPENIRMTDIKKFI